MSPSHFGNFFEPYIPNHDHDTRNDPSSEHSIPPGSVSLVNIEIDSLKYKCAQDWNEMLKLLHNTVAHTQSLIDVSIPNLKIISNFNVLFSTFFIFNKIKNVYKVLCLFIIFLLLFL